MTSPAATLVLPRGVLRPGVVDPSDLLILGAIADTHAAQRLPSDLPRRHLSFAYVPAVVALASAGRSEEAHQGTDAVVIDEPSRSTRSPSTTNSMSHSRCVAVAKARTLGYITP